MVGPSRTALAISWNGMASYGGIAFGTPPGVILADRSDAAEGLTLLGPPPALIGGVGLTLAVLRLAWRWSRARVWPSSPSSAGCCATAPY